MTGYKKAKPPTFAGGLAACHGVSDFTKSAALVFIDGFFQYDSLPGFKL
jgi:hypothetical protein